MLVIEVIVMVHPSFIWEALDTIHQVPLLEQAVEVVLPTRGVGSMVVNSVVRTICFYGDIKSLLS